MNALIIFVKNPEKGKVKTRLAATVGDDKALQIYLELLRHTRNVANQTAASRFLYYSQSIKEKDNWPKTDFQKRLQSGEDLGQKMANAFREVLQHHPKAVIIGSDCASLSTEIVEEAFKLLDKYDFVIGPAMDGGYYLLGMREFHPEVFENIAWSTDEVGSSTLLKIDQLGKTYSLLPLLSDIDHEEDWKKYGWDIEGA
jgi:rSAM/selenodomain-associated transferase 1